MHIYAYMYILYTYGTAVLLAYSHIELNYSAES